MHKTAIRLLAMALCAVMLLGLLPAMTASAAETTAQQAVPFNEAASGGEFTDVGEKAAKAPGTRETAVQKGLSILPGSPRTVEGSADTYYSFTTFADLQTLAAQTYSTDTFAVYVGTGPLVISADLTIPDYLILIVEEEIQIAAGVSFTSLYLLANSVTVYGTLACAYMEVIDALTVYGTLYNYGTINIEETTAVTGSGNIAHYNADCAIISWHYISDMSGLRNAAATAAASQEANRVYSLLLNSAGFAITENVTIPANCQVQIADGVTITVSAGCALTLQCYVFLRSQLVVNGTVNNEGALDIYYDEGGLLTIGSTGTYSGSGYLYVDSDALSDPSAAVPGLQAYVSTLYEDTDYRYWELTVADGSPTQMGTPTNLQWGYDYDTGAARAVPGYISWTSGSPNNGSFYVEVSSHDGSYYNNWNWSFNDVYDYRIYSIDSFINSDPESGTYYFSVTANGDGDVYFDSETIVSGTWTYVKPANKLPPATNPSIDADYLYWDDPDDMTYVDGFEAELYYSPTADGEPTYVGTMSQRYDSGVSYYHDWVGYDSGEGYYSFRVRNLSSDITLYCNSDWSEMSNSFYYTTDSGDSGDSGDTGDDNTGDEDTLTIPFNAYEWEVLRLVNQQRLIAGVSPLTGFALLQEAANIREEEVYSYFSHTRPDGTQCFTVFDEIGLDCGYAGENIARGQQTPAAVMNSWMNSDGHRANILSANYAHIGIGFYNYAWVQMFTDGGSYSSINVVLPEDCTVSQGTTLADLDLVAVLDSSKYGECYLPVEAAYCSGYDPEQLGTQNVTISILGVSSTFQITVVEMRGDFNNDGTVDDADVAYLLWYTLFSDLYPLSEDGDIDRSGTVDDADVAYLLWYTLFPDMYPL